MIFIHNHRKLGKKEIGIYRIDFDDKYFYIGSSVNLKERISYWKTCLLHNSATTKKIRDIVPNTSVISFSIIQYIENNEDHIKIEDSYIKLYLQDSNFLNHAESSYYGKKSIIASKKNKIDGSRKEVHLSEQTIETLQEVADSKKWSLKKLMEIILIERAIKEKDKKKIKSN